MVPSHETKTKRGTYARLLFSFSTRCISRSETETEIENHKASRGGEGGFSMQQQGWKAIFTQAVEGREGVM